MGQDYSLLPETSKETAVLSPEFLLLGTSLQLQDNAYDGLLIAINPRVSEDQSLVPNIMEMITEASSYLFNATKRRVYFGNVKILIPATWKAHNYSQAKQESYEKANIIIADWYRKHRDDPYTLQYGGCGEEGKYIHFTPNFLLNDNLTAIYGPRGRVFVHEWAHLRWGVFDEYNNEKPFYMAGHNQVKVTRCSSDLTGIFVCEKNTCTQENCIIHNLFKERCIFIHNNTQNITASIMYMQSLSSVVEFCNSSTHNQEAPNLQNQMCSLRSTWDVIMDSADFRQSSPLNVTALPALPSFSLLQAGQRVVCLVLDVSAKMAEADRLHRLRQAAEFYLLQVVETHTYVGIVSFSSTAMVKAQPREIKNHQDRRQLSSALPTSVMAKNAGASVCLGLQMGLQVIESQHGNAYGSVIILATSGGVGDISSCLSTMVNSGSTIHTIALGPSVAENLEELSTLTGGLKFFVSDRANSNGLMDAFSGISSGTGDVFRQPVQLDSMGAMVGVHQIFSRTVTVDGSLGNETIFTVMWQGGPPDMVLLSPGGKKYFTGDFNTDSGLRSSCLRIPDRAQAGSWTWQLNNTHSSPQALRVAVSSRATDHAVPPITVTAHVNKDGTRFPHPVIIYADVKEGFHPILQANVTAIIETDAGEPVRLELFDDGAGADIIKNDGIYSRYFFSFPVNGRYSLKVIVHQESHLRRLPHFIPGSYAMYVPGYIVNGNIQMNAPKKSIGDSDIQMQKWGFNRTTSGGSFSVQDVPTGPHADVFPPCRIINLETIRKEEEIILTWSAPGDDFDQGQAASYEVRMSKSLQKIKDEFRDTILVNVSQLIPQRAGSREIFVFTPALLTKEQQQQLDEETGEGNRVYFAIRATDEASLQGQVSNIVQATLIIPQYVSPVTSRESLILKGVLTAIGLIMTICFMICLAHCTLSRKKKSRKKANRTKLL